MDLIKPFTEFLNLVVLPQYPGYDQWINASNAERRLQELRDVYRQSFSNGDLFEVDLTNRRSAFLQIQSNLAAKTGSAFEEYNQSLGNGIPNALLIKHLVNFIEYFQIILDFGTLQELVDRVNEKLGLKFCNEFQRKRIHFNGNSRVASSVKLLGDARDNYWTINIGSERELQYHLYLDDDELGYGLAFNAQKSQNNLDPLANVQPFINSFF